jgi:mycofactocin precursor peptide peptidase
MSGWQLADLSSPEAGARAREHAGLPRTLSIGQAALELLVTGLGRSAAMTFAHVLPACAPGGNAEPLARAVAALRAESVDVLCFMPSWEGDPHAGHEETALMLELAPERVLMELAEPGDTRPLSQTWPLLRSGGVRSVRENGTLGDPTRASAAQRRALLDRLAGELADDVAQWREEVPA